LRASVTLHSNYLMRNVPEGWKTRVPDAADGFVRALLWELAHQQHVGPLSSLVVYV
jgi:hypothetical protein